MTGCRHWRKRIPEAIYGELDAKTRGELESHLASCEECAGLYEKMSAAVRKMEARPAPDRPAQFWEGYWDRLEARMAHEAEASRARRTPPIPAWAYGAAAGILLITLGIVIGRTLLRPREDLLPMAQTAASEAARTEQPALESGPDAQSFAVRASRYLKRSRVLLLAVVNSDSLGDDPFRLNLPLQKKTSEELLQEAEVLKKGLPSSDRRLERLISDLEMILLQIANLAADSDDADIEIIRAGVESRDILFKINLSEGRRPPGKSPAGQPRA